MSASTNDTDELPMIEREITITADGVKEIVTLFNAIAGVFDYFDTSLEDFLSPVHLEALHKWLTIFHSVLEGEQDEIVERARVDEWEAFRAKWTHHGERDDEDGWAFPL